MERLDIYKLLLDINKKSRKRYTKNPDVLGHIEENYKLIKRKLYKNPYEEYSTEELAEILLEGSKNFLDFSNQYHQPGLALLKDEPEKELKNQISRIFLGISAERALKALLLLNGYCIHKLRGKKRPHKIVRLKSITDKSIIQDRTHRFSDLIDKLSIKMFYDKRLPKNAPKFPIGQMKEYLKKASDWRNDDIHQGIRKAHDEKLRDLVVGYIELLQRGVDTQLERVKYRKTKNLLH